MSMRRAWTWAAVVTGCLAAAAGAVRAVSGSDMSRWLAGDGVDLAMRAQPMFLFGRARKQPPCIPTAAVVDGGKQAPASKLCDYPDVGCDCRNPGVPVGNPSPAFPVYFSFQRCSNASVRVAYNLFYTKDGAQPDKLFGHAYDWERVIVVWSEAEAGDGNGGTWQPAQLLLSQHTGYGRLDWAEIQNTFNTEDAARARGGVNGRTGLDHPKVYVEWSKHAHRDTMNTRHDDPFSQLGDGAFRSQDWWYFPKREDYILADRSTETGRLIASFAWGDADSTPPLVHDGLCTA